MLLHGYTFIKRNADLPEGYAYIVEIIKDDEKVGYIKRIELKGKGTTRTFKISVNFIEINKCTMVEGLKESNHKVKEYRQLIVARIDRTAKRQEYKHDIG